jgi:cobalt-zinc-cadmium resistance protein CzcA
MPQILIEYNRNTIAQYNLNIQDINKVVNAAFAGQSSGLLFEGEKRFDLVVRIKGDLKKDLKDIQQLLIPTPSGIQVPLSQLASVEIKDGPNQIQREDAKRRIVIGFNVRGRDVETIVKELQQKIEKQVKFPVGYYLTYGGAFENLNAAKARLMIAVPVSLLLIFLLLYFAFNSIKHGLLIYSAIPLSAIGGIFFLALRDMPFSISAGVGFIALFGVAVLNGIVLIAEFNRLKNDGMDNLRTIVLTGTSLRLRPVLMTAFVASLGFLPMALSNGAGAEVQRPLATVVIGGLMIATFLTLFVLPVLYMMFEKGFNASLPINKGVAILLGCLFVGSVAIAQTDSVRLYSAQPISVQAAVDSALKNNLLVKNEQLKMQYQQMLIGTAGNLPKTSVIGEIGQINSIYTDTRLGISQSIAFPTFYKRERALLAAEFKNSVLNIAIQEALLKKQVQQVYYNMVYLQKKKELLLFADSLYSAFYQKAALRLKTGESNILEKTSAETLLGQIKIQVQQLNQDAAIMQLQLQLLLNTKFAYQPETNRGPLNPASLLDTALLRNHPVLQSMLQQQSIAMANTEVEKSKLLPDLSVGILNGSIRGVGADNIFYSGKRFSSVQVGMGIPLFTKAQKARINSAALSEKMAESKYEQVKQQLTTEYQTAIAQFSKYLATVQYLEKTGLKNAQLITETANKQLSAGSINYLEWVQLINQATSVKNDYTEAVRSLNESIIQLTYYIQQ